MPDNAAIRQISDAYWTEDYGLRTADAATRRTVVFDGVTALPGWR